MLPPSRREVNSKRLPRCDLLTESTLDDAVVDDVVKPYDGELCFRSSVGERLDYHLSELLCRRVDAVIVEQAALPRGRVNEPLSTALARVADRALGPSNVRQHGVPDRGFGPPRLTLGCEVKYDIGAVHLEHRLEFPFASDVYRTGDYLGEPSMLRVDTAKRGESSGVSVKEDELSGGEPEDAICQATTDLAGRACDENHTLSKISPDVRRERRHMSPDY